MSYKHSNVKVYTNKSGWIDWEPSDDFREIYWFIESKLISMLGKGTKESTQMKMGCYNNNGITVDVLGQECHRLCAVIYVLQANKRTDGVRYLIYGMSYDFDSTYGIGIDLHSVSKEEREKFYPGGDVAMFI